MPYKINLNNKPELLAPAGNMECLKTAADMGADAVYLSGKSFGARSFADNFSREEILQAIEYCHLRGVKVHVTVNTLIGDRELSDVRDTLLFLSDAGADAVIIQDLGVLRLARSLGIRPQLHASTQLTVHSLDGALSAARLGFDRVVLARELDSGSIKHISANCGIETEVFIHGAMCMSYSGQCLMSSMLGGRSGNRGSCAQPCRQLYSCTQGSGGARFALSLKDMSLAERIPELLECGVASFKIEGRMKGSAYVGCTAKIYSDCIRDGRVPTAEEKERLKRVFYRGEQSSGYFDGKLGPNMFTFEKKENPYESGSEKIAAEIGSEAERRGKEFGIPLKGRIYLAEGEKIRFSVSGGGESADVESESAAETAKSRAADRESVLSRLRKTGGSGFEFTELDAEIKGRPFVAVSELNDIRRRAIEAVKGKILQRRMPLCGQRSSGYGRTVKPVSGQGMTATVCTAEQYRAICEFERESGKRFAYIYIPAHVLLGEPDEFCGDGRLIAELPAVYKDDMRGKLERLSKINAGGLRIHNISGFEYGEYGFDLFGSWRLNVTNFEAARECAESGICALMPSIELSLPQLRDIIKASVLPIELMAYGRAPLMVTENCIPRNFGACPCGGETRQITDRLGIEFPIVRDGNSCRSVLLNSRPLFMADKLGDLRKLGAQLINLHFTVETSEEIKLICGAYLGINNYRIEQYTRMHYYKGII